MKTTIHNKENSLQEMPFVEEFKTLKDLEFPREIDIADKTMKKIYGEIGKKRRFMNTVIAASLLAACFVGVIFITTTRMRENNDQAITDLLTQVYFQDDFQQSSFDEDIFADINFE